MTRRDPTYAPAPMMMLAHLRCFARSARALRVLLLWSLLAAGCSRSEKSAPAADRAAPAPGNAPAAAPAPGQEPKAPKAPAATPAGKDPAAARALIAAGALVIDVRTSDEYAEGHLPKSTLIPVDELGGRLAEVDKLAGGDKSRPIVVYCASGQRAGKAKRQLEEAGYTKVVNGGGFDDLQ